MRESNGPLFEKPLDRVLGALSFNDRGLLRRYFEDSSGDGQDLAGQIDAYLENLKTLQSDNEFLDFESAKKIAEQCKALLDGLDKEHHQLVQAGIRYFIEGDDTESDFDSPIGFDDDAEVIRLIAKEIGREDVLKLGGDTP